MKRLSILSALAVGALTLGAAEKPAAPKYVDPNPYADYRLAMQSTEQDPLAAVWSLEKDAEIAAATEVSVLAAFVEDAGSADLLLAQIRPAYETDPIILTQVAAVTQWVMTEEPCFLCFWAPSPAAGRAIWVDALERRIATATDEYVKTFCRQQLALCK